MKELVDSLTASSCATILQVWVFVGVRYLEAVCIDKLHLEFEYCLLYGIKKCPPLGGYFCSSTIVISIRNTVFVRCREFVRFLEGLLWEVLL